MYNLIMKEVCGHDVDIVHNKVIAEQTHTLASNWS